MVDKTKFLKTHWLILLWFGKNTDGQTADGQIIHIKKKTPKQTYCTRTKYVTEHQYFLCHTT